MRKKIRLWGFALEPQDGNFMFSYLTLSKSLKRKKSKSIRIAPVVFLILFMAFNFYGLKSAFGWGEVFDPAAQDSKAMPSATAPENEGPDATASDGSQSSDDFNQPCNNNTPDEQICTDDDDIPRTGSTFRQK